MANMQVTVVDGNNVTVSLDRGVAGVGIASVELVVIDSANYLLITYTNGETQTVGPVGVIQYSGTSPINIAGSVISLTTVPVNLGGTGQTTANAGLNALLPAQTGQANKYLQTDGTNSSWDAISLSTADITGVLPVVNGGTGVATSTGTGSTVLSTSPTLVTPILGTPTSGTLTNATGLPVATGISGLGTGVATFLATPSSANLAAALTDETGTGAAVFATSPTLVTPALGTPASGIMTNVTGTAAGLTAGNVTTNANLTGDVTSIGNATTLATVATAGVTGSSTAIPVVTINAKGLTTSITTAAVIAPAGTLSGSTLAAGVTGSSLTSLGTIANLSVTAGTISTTPSASTDIANKDYVDTVAQGLDPKASCVAATTIDITLSAPQTIDGIALIAGDRCLVKNQSAPAENGIYVVAAAAWTRAADMNAWVEVPGAFTFIEQGTTQADTGWVCTSNAGGTLGTTAITFVQFAGVGSYTAGTGLTLTGTAFSLTAPVTVALGGTNATSAGIAAFNNISGYTASGATGTTSTNLVFSTSPTLVTPILGIPQSATLTNATGLPLTTGVTGTLPVANGGTGLTAGTSGGVLAYTAAGTLASSSALAASALVIGGGAGAAPSTTTTGTGVVTALGVNTGSAGAFVVNGGALGTPSSGTLTNATGLPLTTGVTGTLPVANGGTNLTSFTSGGVVYASSTSALATGSALTFDGTSFKATGKIRANNAGVPTADVGFVTINGYQGTSSANGGFAIVPTTEGGAEFYTHTGAVGAESYAEQMRLTSTGLGIGTSSPTAKLYVNANNATATAIFQDENNGAKVRLLANSINFDIGNNGTNAYLAVSGATALAFNTNGSERMRLDSSGNLGIGTSSPDVSYKATISGNTGGVSPGILYVDQAASPKNYALNINGSKNFVLRNVTDGANIWEATSSGNLGLGVTPSAWGSGYKAMQIGDRGTLTYSGGVTSVANNAYNNGTNWKHTAAAYSGLYAISDNTHVWYTGDFGSADTNITFTQAMTLDASGNLGVGTSSPISKLTVLGAGTINAPETTTTGSSIQTASYGITTRTGNLELGATDARAANIGGSLTFSARYTSTNATWVTGKIAGYRETATDGVASSYLAFATTTGAGDLTERARIDSSGNLLIGTTSTAVNPGIVVYGGISNAQIQIGHGNGVSSGEGYLGFQYNGSAIGSITQSGTTAVLYNVTSDQRLKENIQDADSASSLIDSLQVRKFDWKTDRKHQRYGFVAQELVTVAPEAVYQPTDTDEMMAVDYSKLVPMLVKEIQSLRQRLSAANI